VTSCFASRRERSLTQSNSRLVGNGLLHIEPADRPWGTLTIKQVT
jgi:hypothetical protein